MSGCEVPIENLQAAPKPPKSPIAKYIAAMLNMQAKTATKNGVKLKIAVVPDAYLFFMAKTYQDYEDLGLDEKLLARSWRAPIPSTSDSATASFSGSTLPEMEATMSSSIKASPGTSR